MSKKLTASLLAATALALAACGNSTDAKDTPSPESTAPATSAIQPTETMITSAGTTATATSQADDQGSSATLSVTWEGDKIIGVQWNEYTGGEPKDENYGKDLGEELYKSAQDALKGSATYPEQLLDKQDIDQVDAVSGATNSYDNFKQLYKECAEQK